jgi:hypothetical protein
MADIKIKTDKLTKFVSSFTTIGLFAGIGILSMAVFGIASHLENLIPAEFQILLSILKNRFFR